MTSGRTRHNYTGTSVAERQVERRALFIDAGLTVFAEKSYANSSLTDVCAVAGLSRRQFYEQFAGREELLVAVYDAVQDKAGAAVAEALAAAESDDVRALIDAAVRAYAKAITDDIRCAKVAFVDIVGVSPEIEKYRAQVRDRSRRRAPADNARRARRTTRAGSPVARPRRLPWCCPTARVCRSSAGSGRTWRPTPARSSR